MHHTTWQAEKRQAQFMSRGVGEKAAKNLRDSEQREVRTVSLFFEAGACLWWPKIGLVGTLVNRAAQELLGSSLGVHHVFFPKKEGEPEVCFAYVCGIEAAQKQAEAAQKQAETSAALRAAPQESRPKDQGEKSEAVIEQ